jgi:hypothetical protein
MKSSMREIKGKELICTTQSSLVRFTVTSLFCKIHRESRSVSSIDATVEKCEENRLYARKKSAIPFGKRTASREAVVDY